MEDEAPAPQQDQVQEPRARAQDGARVPGPRLRAGRLLRMVAGPPPGHPPGAVRASLPGPRGLRGLPSLERPAGRALGGRPERLEPGRLGRARAPRLERDHRPDRGRRARRAPPRLRREPRLRAPLRRRPRGAAGHPRRDRAGRLPGRERLRGGPDPPSSPGRGGSDDHVLVVDRDECELFELYRGEYRDGPRNKWRADSTAFFDLRSGGLRPDAVTSADAGSRSSPASSATTRSRRGTSTTRSG